MLPISTMVRGRTPFPHQHFLKGNLYSMVEASTQGKEELQWTEKKNLQTPSAYRTVQGSENCGPQCSVVHCSGLEPRLWTPCFISLRAEVLEPSDRLAHVPTPALCCQSLQSVYPLWPGSWLLTELSPGEMDHWAWNCFMIMNSSLGLVCFFFGHSLG